MTTVQITVRLPEDLVAGLDEQVQSGAVSSRAAAVAQALREQRFARQQAHDITVYAAEVGQPDPDDLAGLVAYASRTPLDID